MNFLKHSVDIRHDLIVPESQHTITFAFEKSCSRVIGYGIFGMLTAIHLNNESAAMACEVDNEFTKPYLSSKMCTGNFETMP